MVPTFRFVVAVCALLWPLLTVQGAPTVVRGTRVSIDAPPGFELAQDFAGFVNRAEPASIMVTEMPIPLDQLMAGFSAEAISSRGMTLMHRGAVVIDGRKAVLLSLRQHHGASPFLKWVACFGSDTGSVMLMATFPESLPATSGERLKAAILGAKWTTGEKPVGVFQGLKFELQRSADIQPLQQIQGMVVLGRSGEFGTPGTTKPVMIAGALPGPTVTTANWAAASKGFVLQSNRLLNVVFQKEARVRIAGFDALEIEGTAQARQSGAPLVFYQAWIPHASGNLVIYGEVGVNDKAIYLPRFRGVANTLTFK